MLTLKSKNRFVNSNDLSLFDEPEGNIEVQNYS